MAAGKVTGRLLDTTIFCDYIIRLYKLGFVRRRKQMHSLSRRSHSWNRLLDKNWIAGSQIVGKREQKREEFACLLLSRLPTT